MITLQSVLQDIGYETRSYSGRNMYDRECLGVVTEDSIGTMFGAILRHVAEKRLHLRTVDEIAEGIEDIRTDDMGRSTVVYFPSVAFEAPEETDDSED